MNVSWHPEAREDLREASQWYETQSRGLGFEFTDAVESAIERIAMFGDTFAVADPEDPTRICPVHRFPYHILFKIVGDTVQMLCVKHNRRHPDYGVHRR